MFIDVFKSQTLKNISVVLFGNIFSVLLGFIFVILTARRLGPSEFGIFSTILAYSIFVSAISDLGVSQSIVKFFHGAKNKMEQKKWLTSGFLSVLLSSITISIVASALYQFILRIVWHHQTSQYWLPLLLMNVVIALNTFLLSYFQTRETFLYRAAIDNLFSIIRITITIYIISINQLSVTSGLWIIVMAYLIAIVVGMVIAREWIFASHIDVQKIITLLGFGRWLAASNIFANLYGKLDVLMLAGMVSAYQTGLYAAASRFITIFPLVVSSLSAVAAPRFAQFDSHEQASAYLKKLSYLVGLVSLGMLSLLLFGKFIIITAYSNDFAPAISLFRYLVLAYIPLVLSVPAGNILVYFYKKPEIITLISSFQLIGLGILNYMMIPIYGATGVVIGLAIMNTLGMGVQYLFVYSKRI